jgi:branched-chain amino acid transport system ATP-binding protein
LILEIDDIHCFYGLSHVLHGVSLSIAAGEVVSLLGRNGAGKTTTISSVVGLMRPQSGDIRVAGRSILESATHEICRMGVAWVPQGRRLFPNLTVKENIHLATLKLGARGGADAFDRAYALFPRLGERVDTYAANLSGGEQQMLAVARALVGSPRLVLFDEPTEGLSPMVIMDIMRVVKEIASSGAAVLLAEQNVRVAMRVADRHYILDHGEVRFSSSTAELERRGDIVAEYLGVKARSAIGSE